MAMTDEERIIEALAKARVKASLRQPWDDICEEDRGHFKSMAARQLSELRALGGDVTMPPAPEPTYTRTFTEREWAYVINALDDYHAPGPLMPDGRLLVNHMQGQQPDSEPGA